MGEGLSAAGVVLGAVQARSQLLSAGSGWLLAGFDEDQRQTLHLRQSKGPRTHILWAYWRLARSYSSLFIRYISVLVSFICVAEEEIPGWIFLIFVNS